MQQLVVGIENAEYEPISNLTKEKVGYMSPKFLWSQKI